MADEENVLRCKKEVRTGSLLEMSNQGDAGCEHENCDMCEIHISQLEERMAKEGDGKWKDVVVGGIRELLDLHKDHDDTIKQYKTKVNKMERKCVEDNDLITRYRARIDYLEEREIQAAETIDHYKKEMDNLYMILLDPRQENSNDTEAEQEEGVGEVTVKLPGNIQCKKMRNQMDVATNLEISNAFDNLRKKLDNIEVEMIEIQEGSSKQQEIIISDVNRLEMKIKNLEKFQTKATMNGQKQQNIVNFLDGKMSETVETFNRYKVETDEAIIALTSKVTDLKDNMIEAAQAVAALVVGAVVLAMVTSLDPNYLISQYM